MFVKGKKKHLRDSERNQLKLCAIKSQHSSNGKVKQDLTEYVNVHARVNKQASIT